MEFNQDLKLNSIVDWMIFLQVQDYFADSPATSGWARDFDLPAYAYLIRILQLPQSVGRIK